jgi:cytochrome c-type biogenesis protein CcmH/NrfF
MISQEQQERIRKLETMFLSPCCYAEPVSRHMSPKSTELKTEIASFVETGKSDREIIDHYKAKYGARVLVEPEGAAWWWMQIIPITVLVLGTVFVIWLLKRMRAQAALNA